MSEKESKFEGISFKPSSVKFPKYVIMGYCGKAEAEETMARIITLLQEAKDEWGKVRYYDLRKMVDSDIETMNNAILIQNSNSQKRLEYDRECRCLKNRLKSWWTGVQVVKEPVMEKVPETPEFTTVLLYGVNAIVVGIQHLINVGFIEKSFDGEYECYTPTEKALARFQEMDLVH